MFVVLGGSSPWTVDLIDRLNPEEVVLVGQNDEALEALRRFLRRRSDTTVHISTDPQRALEEASIVLCQVRVGGWSGRREDESGPLQWGGYGDETLGLGGLRAAVRASRTFAAWARIARHARVVMLSNPTDLLTRWWRHHSEAEAISVCEVPTELMSRLPAGTRYLGVNHLGWALTPAGQRVPTRWLPLADDLEGEVARQYVAPLHRADQLARLSRALRRAIAVNDHERFDVLLSHRSPRWYGSMVVPVLQALLRGRPFWGVVGLPNNGRLPGLSSQLVVESLGSLDEANPEFLPYQLIEDVACLARARERAWEMLVNPTDETLREYVAADPFSTTTRHSSSLLSWVLSGQ